MRPVLDHLQRKRTSVAGRTRLLQDSTKYQGCFPKEGNLCLPLVRSVCDCNRSSLYGQAWADGAYSQRWAEEFCDMVNTKAPGHHLLLLDELKAQMRPVRKSETMSMLHLCMCADSMYAYVRTDRQTDRQTNRQTNRQTDRQIDR